MSLYIAIPFLETAFTNSNKEDLSREIAESLKYTKFMRERYGTNIDDFNPQTATMEFDHENRNLSASRVIDLANKTRQNQYQITYQERERADELLRKGINLVEKGRYETAIHHPLQSIEMNPTNGHAFNELAYVFGKKYGELDIAEKYAIKAVESDPMNLKFFKALLGIQGDRVNKLKSCSLIYDEVQKRLLNMQSNREENFDSVFGHIYKGILFAAMGEEDNLWEMEFKKAEEMVIQQNINQSSVSLPPEVISYQFDQYRSWCIKLKENFLSFSE